jgi:hypothetical protein
MPVREAVTAPATAVQPAQAARSREAGRLRRAPLFLTVADECAETTYTEAVRRTADLALLLMELDEKRQSALRTGPGSGRGSGPRPACANSGRTI